MLTKAERDERRYGNVCYEDTEALLYQTCDELEALLEAEIKNHNIGAEFDDAQILKLNEEVTRLRSLCREAEKHLAIYLDDLCVSGCGECDTCVLWRRLKEEGEKP